LELHYGKGPRLQVLRYSKKLVHFFRNHDGSYTHNNHSSRLTDEVVRKVQVDLFVYRELLYVDGKVADD
jgi:hypothetical protein